MNRKFIIVGHESGDGGYAENAGNIAERDVPHDSNLETNLVLLLSETAQSMDEIQEANNNRPVEVLITLAGIANRMAEFSEHILDIDPEDGFLAEALVRASESYTNINILHIENNRISPQTAVNLYKGWTGEGKEKNSIFSQMSMGVVDIIESYFDLISDSFNTKYVADEWRDAFKICSVELRQLVNGVTF